MLRSVALKMKQRSLEDLPFSFDVYVTSKFSSSLKEREPKIQLEWRQIIDCVFRLFDSSKYLTTFRSNISPCQKATTLIIIPLYNPSFHLWKPWKKIFGHNRIFVLDVFSKSATVTSFSQLHLSRNSDFRRSLDQINLHFLVLYTRWSIKKANKCENFRDFL